jgi:ABC-type polysaccharide/polyol phosphate transport system ATPase subunit
MKGTPELTGRENMYLRGAILGNAAVSIQNLNPDVLMMKPAEDWY